MERVMPLRARPVAARPVGLVPLTFSQTREKGPNALGPQVRP